MSANAYACTNPDGTLNVRTVQDTERGAMVNGLLVFGGYMATRFDDEEKLWEMFHKHLEPLGVKIVPVVIAFDVAEPEPVKADPTHHASTSPGPVNCNMVLIFQGKPRPRTCKRCRFGPCPFFNKDGTSTLLNRPDV